MTTEVATDVDVAACEVVVTARAVDKVRRKRFKRLLPGPIRHGEPQK